jgi:photosystem II stability/assembly factor-like uncharacterized protein
MADASVGYLVGGRTTALVMRLYRTADGGRSWRDVSPGNPVAPPTTVGAQVVYVPVRVRGSIVVERSSDGGATWRASAPVPDRHVAGPGAVRRVDARHFFLAVGEGAAAGSSAQSLWRSDDGAQTWTFVSRTQSPSAPQRPGVLPFGCDKTGVAFATPTRGWAAGACAGGPAFLYRTDDGGKTWRPLRLAGLSRCACDVSPPAFANARDGAFGVNGFPQEGGKPIFRVYWTSDGGLHWRATRPPAGRIGAPQIVDGRTAWVAGAPPGSIRIPFTRLYRTTDAGRHWQVTRLPFDGDIDAVSATVAYAVVGQKTLWRTSDGGRSWRRVPRYP